MIQTELLKTVAMISPISATVGATQSGTVDTLNYKHATILITLDTAGTNPSAIVLGDGTVTNSFTDLTDFVGDDADGFTIPAVDVTDPQIIRFEVDLNQVDRYLELVITTGATQVNSALCLLSQGNTAQDIAGWGVSAMVQGNT